MTDRNLPVVIAGGGVGGLATALALAQRGIASTVHEKRAAYSEDGAGIQLGPNGVHVLRALGVADEVARSAAVPECIVVHDGRSGRIITKLPLGTWIEDRHGAPYWTVQRPHLHAALLTAAARAPLVTLMTGSDVIRFQERGEHIEIETAVQGQVVGQQPEPADRQACALIAADGLWSTLRNTIGHPSALRPIGKAAYRALLPAAASDQIDVRGAVHVWLAPGAHVVHYPVSGGAETAFVVIVDDSNATASWSTAATNDAVLEGTRGFCHQLRHVMAAASNWRMWSLQSRAPSQTWSRGRAAVLGDAAHPVLPYLAQGGVLALEDAIVLARCLDQYHSDTPTALRTYADARRARAARVATASARNGRIYHVSGVAASARDAALTRLPPPSIMRAYDWLYGWRDTTT